MQKINQKLDKNFFKNACTKCGFCEDIFPNKIKIDIKKNVSVKLHHNLDNKEKAVFSKFCPGIGFNYLKRKKNLKFDNLIGNYVDSYISYSLNKKVRLNSSSGGVLTEVILNLLKNKEVDYVIMPLQMKNPNQLPRYSITRNLKDIKVNSQSIYTKIPSMNIIKKIIKSNKKFCFVGLPDQTMALRNLMEIYPIIKKNIKYIIGPMVGINMDPNSLDGIKKIYGINKNIDIKKLRWRDGEWPGYLYIKYSNNFEVRLKKFYYNFLLPFYCSQESLTSCDFTNEAADISVGDAWSPKYENKGGGWSVAWSKSKKGEKILKILKNKNKIYLKKISSKDAKRMHLHMLDFKKRGSQYRNKIYNFFGIAVPKNKIKSVNFSYKRLFIELIILISIGICKSNFGKLILRITNPTILGSFFSFVRIIWKKATYNIKRKDIHDF